MNLCAQLNIGPKCTGQTSKTIQFYAKSKNQLFFVLLYSWWTQFFYFVFFLQSKQKSLLNLGCQKTRQFWFMIQNTNLLGGVIFISSSGVFKRKESLCFYFFSCGFSTSNTPCCIVPSCVSLRWPDTGTGNHKLEEFLDVEISLFML